MEPWICQNCDINVEETYCSKCNKNKNNILKFMSKNQIKKQECENCKISIFGNYQYCIKCKRNNSKGQKCKGCNNMILECNLFCHNCNNNKEKWKCIKCDKYNLLENDFCKKCEINITGRDKKNNKVHGEYCENDMEIDFGKATKVTITESKCENCNNNTNNQKFCYACIIKKLDKLDK